MKKHFNNLGDSIFATGLFIGSAVLTAWGMESASTAPNPTAAYIIIPCVLGIPCVGMLTFILIYGYGLWYVENDTIHYRRFFIKKSICRTNIVKVEEKCVNALIFSTFQIDAHIIHSLDGQKIVIYIDKRKFPELDRLISEYLPE